MCIAHILSPFDSLIINPPKLIHLKPIKLSGLDKNIKQPCLTCIKGHNPVINLRKTTCYNLKLDLVTVNVHTKFRRVLSIHSQEI